MKYIIFVALFAISSTADITLVDDIRNRFYALEDKLWRQINNSKTNRTIDPAPRLLAKDFLAFDRLIQTIPVPCAINLNDGTWSRALEEMRMINEFYIEFIRFVDEGTPAEVDLTSENEWLSLTHAVLFEKDTSIAELIRILNDMVGDGNVFRSVLQEHPDLCELQMSPHQLIYDMYNTISLTGIKGYAMMQFSWMLLRIYGIDNNGKVMARLRYSDTSFGLATAARFALKSASREVLRCVPEKHVAGETYAEVTGLLQGYIENEVDMNEGGSCSQNCAHYTTAKRQGCYMNEYCSKQRGCYGRIFNCQFIDSDMWICPAKLNSTRRYDFIEYENGRKFGKTGSCHRRRVSVESWWRGFYHCSYCMCLCEQSLDMSDRSFSLSEAVTDIHENKVVTGLRIVKRGRVFHLQVKDGQLGSSGQVSPGNWIPLTTIAAAKPVAKGSGDYHTLTYEKRAVDLDELESPLDHVLTGVRFRVIDSHLRFEIRSTLFNYTTGTLAHDRCQWISNQVHTPRSKLELVKPDVPNDSSVPLRVDSKPNQYLEFTHSDLETDAAQTVVPFIDIQPIELLKGGALISGAGVIHTAARGSSGYLILKLIAYDQSRHVSALPPLTEQLIYTDPHKK